MQLRTIELFAGAGGGALAHTHLLKHKVVCYVENNDHCQRVLEQRMRDGWLPRAAVCGDVRTFDGRPWRGEVDCVSGGFPCQPFSSAARGRNNSDLDLWPEMLRVVEEVSPTYVFAENVKREPIEDAAQDLWERGYETAFTRILASEVGGFHRRPRWWLVANADCQGQPRRPIHAKVASLPGVPGLDWWASDVSSTLGMGDGMANRMDRLRATGNGQVPIVAAVAWEALTHELLCSP